MANNKTESISNIIKIYSSWKAVQPHSQLQSNLIEQKLHPKFIKVESSKPAQIQPILQKKEINMRQFKSKEMIPDDYQQRAYQAEVTNEQGNINFVPRKNTGINFITRYKSMESTGTKCSHQKKATLTLPSNAQKHHPNGLLKPFRIKATSTRANSPVKMPYPFSKPTSLRQFCLSNKRQYTAFLKTMIKGDLQMLSRREQLDMNQFVFKVKRQELLRKTRAINRWQSFNYSQIQE